MQLSVIRSIEEFMPLADEWNELLACSASHVPFLRHEYLCAWWKTLGGGEWSQAELYVVVAREPVGKLVAAAPLFLTQNHSGHPALILVGSIEISDYLDILACEEDIPLFINALLDFLSSDQAPAWETLELYNLIESSPTLPALKVAAEGCGYNYIQEQLQHCPYIPLPGDWENYLGGIDKKQRHEIRRKMRRAEESPDPIHWYFVTEEGNLEAEIEAFLDLMAQDEEKERFLTEAMRVQMHLIMQAAFQAGWLQLAFLTIAGKKAAAYLNFDYGGHIWVYNSGLNLELRELSPGWVLLGHLLKWANENGRMFFDFMRGDEDYKYRFGAVDRLIYRASITRPGKARAG